MAGATLPNTWTIHAPNPALRVEVDPRYRHDLACLELVHRQVVPGGLRRSICGTKALVGVEQLLQILRVVVVEGPVLSTLAQKSERSAPDDARLPEARPTVLSACADEGFEGGVAPVLLPNMQGEALPRHAILDGGDDSVQGGLDGVHQPRDGDVGEGRVRSEGCSARIDDDLVGLVLGVLDGSTRSVVPK